MADAPLRNPVISSLKKVFSSQCELRVPAPQGVPSIGIAGRYYTDGTLAGSMDRVLQVADHLVAEARNAR